MFTHRFTIASLVTLFCLAVSVFAFADTPAATPGGGSATAGPAATAPSAPAAATTTTTTTTTGPTVAGVPDPSPDAVTKALRDGDWRMLSAFALVGVMWLLRKARDRVAWLRGDRGGAVLVGLLAMLGAGAAAAASQVKLSPGVLLGALTVAWTAVGGYTWIRRLIWPQDNPAATTKLVA